MNGATGCDSCKVAIAKTAYQCQMCGAMLCKLCMKSRSCCSGNASSPGWVIGGDRPELPFSEGDTSRAAAVRMAPHATRLRARVLVYIFRRGPVGATDDEGNEALEMRQVSYGARRNELMHNPKKGCEREIPAYV